MRLCELSGSVGRSTTPQEEHIGLPVTIAEDVLLIRQGARAVIHRPPSSPILDLADTMTGFQTIAH